MKIALAVNPRTPHYCPLEDRASTAQEQDGEWKFISEVGFEVRRLQGEVQGEGLPC